MFDPVSPQAKAISDVFSIVLLIGLAVLALVTGLVIYAIIRFRARQGDETPKQISGNIRLEIGWTLGPVVLTILLLVLTMVGIANADPTIPPNKQVDIEVHGWRWWWEYRYPATGIVTANELHIPTGQRLLLKLQAGDVIHSFWVPQLGPKRDMLKEYSNNLWIQADKPGLYLGTCSEYCGTQHAGMMIHVIAQTPEDFAAWQEKHRQPPAAPTAPDQVQGAKVFQQQTCVNCHTIAGTAANATVGPNLTYLGTRQTLGSGVIQNTPENLTRWIRNVQEIKPGVLMPGYPQLSEEDLHDLVAYLEGLK
jgi:cytochrome c oxidase subunit II